MASIEKNRKRRGIALVEAALAFPLLLLLTVAVIQYGWLFLKAQQITNAARHGARIAVTADATNAQVQTYITNLITDAGLADSGYAVTLNPGDVATVEARNLINVQISVPAESVNLLDTMLIPLPGSIRASVTMAKEGP